MQRLRSPQSCNARRKSKARADTCGVLRRKLGPAIIPSDRRSWRSGRSKRLQMINRFPSERAFGRPATASPEPQDANCTAGAIEGFDGSIEAMPPEGAGGTVERCEGGRRGAAEHRLTARPRCGGATAHDLHCGAFRQASPEPENSTVGGVARGGGMDRPPGDPGLLLRSYRWARSRSRRLVNGSAFSARSRARCAKLL